jgi:Ca-activated chloride channel homolog
MKLAVQTDRTLIRDAGKSVRYALLEFTAPEAPRAVSSQPLNISFVIDRSGSMGGSKIELARAAVIQALKMLRDSDRFSVISYDNEIEVVVASTLATSEALRNAVMQVTDISARGNTNLGGGWLKGCEQIAEHLNANQIARCLLLSDGLANEGIIDRNELAAHSKELDERGIRTSCFGIGDDYDEVLLHGIAATSGGRSYHVETAVQIPDFLASELGEAFEVVARQAMVIVRPASGITVKTLNDYPLLAGADGSVSLRLGELIARQEVSVVFRMTFPAGHPQETLKAVFTVRDSTKTLTAPDADIVWTFAGHPENDRQPRNRTVDRAVAKLYAAAAQADALALYREGGYDEAVARLEQAAARIEEYAASDPELRTIVADLRQRRVPYSARMLKSREKEEYARSVYAMTMRDSEGKTPRRSN